MSEACGWCPYHGGYIGDFCTSAKPDEPMCCYSSMLGRRISAEEQQKIQSDLSAARSANRE